ncbi:MAG: hypothetical protein ACJZ8O_02445 [Pirellulaceae bacterium]
MEHDHQTRRDGVLFLLRTCVVCCVLLVFNSAFVVAFVEGLAQQYPILEQVGFVRQSILIGGPLFLLGVEWFLYDQFAQRIRL